MIYPENVKKFIVLLLFIKFVIPTSFNSNGILLIDSKYLKK